MVLQHAGTNPVLDCAQGACNFAGAFFLGMLVKRLANGVWQGIGPTVQNAGDTTVQWGLEFSDTDHLSAATQATDRQSVVTTQVVDGWMFVGSGKTAGAQLIRSFVFKGGSWTIANIVNTMTDQASITGGKVRFGRWGTADDSNHRWAAAIALNRLPSDAEVQSLIGTGKTNADWLALTPSGMWEAAATVADLTGNGANETGRAGTVTQVTGDDPPSTLYTLAGGAATKSPPARRPFPRALLIR